ncbi:MAG: hypothetical protein WCO48_02435 [Candidatus Taylorbacteria bacterium]
MHVRVKSGFVAMITVLIITAVSLILGTTMILKSISHASMSASELYSAQAWASANSCVEYALGQFSIASTSWSTYAGGNTLSIGGNNCYVLPISATGTSLLINASSSVASFSRKLQVVVATNTPQSVVSSWQEVGDF